MNFFAGIMALSGYDVQNVRLLEVKTGSIIWETQLQAPDLDRQSEFRCIGSCIVFATDGTPDVFVSSNTGGVHRLNGLTGANKWTWTPVDNAYVLLCLSYLILILRCVLVLLPLCPR